jgi:hypothetical protein
MHAGSTKTATKGVFDLIRRASYAGRSHVVYWPGFVTTARDHMVVVGRSPEAKITPLGCSKTDVLTGLATILERRGFKAHVTMEYKRDGEPGSFTSFEAYW